MTTFNETTHAHETALDPASIQIAAPAASHGAGMWRVAGAAGELDLNSSYMYLVFARDFADTCRVALDGDDVVAFVLGYRRPEHPDRLFVWQVAVDAQHRGVGLAARLLDDLAFAPGGGQPPLRFVETTITDDNISSQRLFASFAARHAAVLETTELFDAHDFPDQHDAERLHRIGPFPLPSRA